MIRVEDVTLRLNKRTILNHISLELQNGRIVGLVGSNGCGKTMLMKCICGFVHPTEGRVVADGKVIGKEVDYLPDAGVMIETPGFIGYYSGLKNLQILAGINHRIDDKRIGEVMRMVGLDPALRLPVKKYSLGMRQRLGIAQALMEYPKMLVLDEPFNGLDEDGVVQMRELLAKQREEDVTILISSHNPMDIEVLCDTVHRIYKGKLSDH